MKRVDVVKKDNKWVGETKGGDVVAQGKTKAEAVKHTANAARKDPEAVSVKIHKQDGKIQEERTYPKSADPKKSKG
jgi:hypothetical protein